MKNQDKTATFPGQQVGGRQSHIASYSDAASPAWQPRLTGFHFPIWFSLHEDFRMTYYFNTRPRVLFLAITALLFLTLARGLAQAPAVSNTSPNTLTTPAGTPAQTLSPVEAIHNLSLVVQKITAHANTRDLAPILSYDFISMKSFQFLLYRPALALPGKQAELKSALTQFSTRLNDVRDAARDRNHALALTRSDALAQAWTHVKELYPPDLLRALSDLSSRYTCPAHSEVIGQKGETCPRCFRSLQMIDQFCGLPSADPVIKPTVKIESPLIPGKESQVTLRLARKDGAPVREIDLLPTHTQRIHLFAIDSTLTDYHHEHPRPTGAPGDYEFAFTPRFRGGYRLWVDLLPAVTLREELPSLDLGAVPPPSITRTISDRFTNSAWHLQLVITRSPLKADFPDWAKLIVTDSAGRPCAKLEPIMGNFAHFVAFHEDLQTVFHLHAAGIKDVVDPSLRSGPEVQLYIPGFKPGYVRLFAQVQIDGQVITAPFGFQVQP